MKRRWLKDGPLAGTYAPEPATELYDILLDDEDFLIINTKRSKHIYERLDESTLAIPPATVYRHIASRRKSV